MSSSDVYRKIKDLDIFSGDPNDTTQPIYRVQKGKIIVKIKNDYGNSIEPSDVQDYVKTIVTNNAYDIVEVNTIPGEEVQ